MKKCRLILLAVGLVFCLFVAQSNAQCGLPGGFVDLKAGQQQTATGQFGLGTAFTTQNGCFTSQDKTLNVNLQAVGGVNGVMYPNLAGVGVVGINGTINVNETNKFGSFNTVQTTTAAVGQASMAQTAALSATATGMAGGYATLGQNQTFTGTACVVLPGGGYASTGYFGQQYSNLNLGAL